MNRQTMTTLPANPINHHLQTKQFDEQRLWRMQQGKFYTELEGKLVDEETFRQLHPIYNPLSFIPTKGSILPSQQWIKQ